MGQTDEKENLKTTCKKEEKEKTDEKAETKEVTNPCEKKQEEKEKNSEEIKEEPPKVGNFALPTSQQPAALFGFGGNILDKDEVQLYLFADYFSGKKRVNSDIIPSVLFGVTNEFSIYFNFPVNPYLRDGKNRSSGIEDFFIQFEYAFYNKSTAFYVDEATIVANITAPTGSTKKNPPTGFGAPSVFIGGTFYHTMVDWFAFTSHGAILMSSNGGTRIGDQFLYQFGFGRNIPSTTDRIYAWMLEIDGQYNKKNRIDRVIDPNSGGNVVYVTPSIWISTKEWLLQFGVSVPVTQNLFGKQHKVDFALNLNFAWSFY